MLTIETVNIKDVRPLKDEYGNKVLCRDYELKENKQYIQKLADNIKAKGVPEEPIVLIRDGGAYRIKAGNTRVEAMKLNGVTHFEAVIDEDTTPENLLELAASVYRTDLKKRFEPTEKARVGQQLFMLDPDDLSLSETIGEPVETIKKRRRGFEIARKKAGDETMQLTMDHFDAIEEFADEEGAFDKIMAASEGDLHWICNNYRNKRKERVKAAKVIAELKARGIEVRDDYDREEYQHFDYVSSPKAVKKLEFDTIEPGDIIAISWSDNSEFSLYVKKSSKLAEQGKSEEEIKYAQRKAKMERVEEARLAFLEDRYPDLPALEALAKEDPDRFDPLEWQTRRFINEHDYLVEIPAALSIIEAFRRCYDSLLNWNGAICNRDRAQEFIDFSACLVADGYMPPEVELELLEEAKTYLDEHPTTDPE